MASQIPADRLFLFEQIQADHEELRATLGVLQHALAARLETVARVSEKLAQVSDQVEAHFVEEEEAAFVDEVCDDDCIVQQKTAEIQEAHGELTKSIQKVLLRFTKNKSQDDWWKEAERGVEQLQDALQKHAKTTKSVLLDS